MGWLERWRFRRYARDIVRRVQNYGWTSVGVTEDRNGGSMSYTIGFSDSVASPEVVICGLNDESVNSILWDAFRHIKDGRMTLAENAPWPGVVTQDACVWRRVHPTNLVPEVFGSGFWYYETRSARSRPLDMFQLVFPDREGRLPWEEGCDLEFLKSQFPYYEPDPDLPRKYELGAQQKS